MKPGVKDKDFLEYLLARMFYLKQNFSNIKLHCETELCGMKSAKMKMFHNSP